MKVRSLMLKPLAAAALLFSGASFAAPPVTNGLSSILGGSGTSGLLNLDVTIGSTMNSLGGGLDSLPALGQATNGNGDSPLNPFAQGSFLHDNPAGHLVFDTVNTVRRGTGGLIPVNSERPDLPGLRKDATSRLVHDLQLYEITETTLDSLTGGASNLNLPVLAAIPVGQAPAGDDGNRRNGDDNDNGFLGVSDSTTLGTDNDRDPGDNGFLGIADSSTLGTD